MAIEIKKPNRPKITIPIAETFEICSNSFRLGFFKVCQTRLHLSKNDLVFVNVFIIERNIKGF